MKIDEVIHSSVFYKGYIPGDARRTLIEAKQSVMFHGTSTAMFRSIMTNGIQPNPPGRTWEDDPHASIHAPSRASLEGSYWTTNLMTAMSSGYNTVKKFGGNRMIVCALIQEQAAFADEDSINSRIERAYGKTMAEISPGVVHDAVGIHLATMMWKPEFGRLAPQKFAQYMHQELAGASKMPIDYSVMARVLHDFMMRKLAYIAKNDPHGWSRWFNEREIPALPSIGEAEQIYHKDLEWLTRRYRVTALSSNETFNHTLRLVLPVGFRGRNRIICILEELRNNETYERDIRVLYGTPPSYLIEEWQKWIGKWSDK